jgi:hypothetical protein
MSLGEKRGETRMKLSTVMRWGGPVAMVSGVFTMFSDLLGLTIYVPGLGEAANTGYQAVGAGVILIALMLLVVGMAEETLRFARREHRTSPTHLASFGGYRRA